MAASTSIEEKPKRTLDMLLKHLIAIQEGIEDSQVTLEYTRNKRWEKIYPDMRFVVSSSYGGYTTAGLKSYSRNDYNKLSRAIDDALPTL